MKQIRVDRRAAADGLNVEITISGSFDESKRLEFSQVFDHIPDNVHRIVVDLKKATSIDQSAIGMLLGLRMFSETQNIDLVLKNCHSTIHPTFRKACVESLFNFG